MLTREEVCELVQVKFSTIWRWIREGLFPPPYKMKRNRGHGGTARWREDDIIAWQDSLSRAVYKPLTATELQKLAAQRAAAEAVAAAEAAAKKRSARA
jgi:predicted DNA-binding transcriptional regulator AlpA